MGLSRDIREINRQMLTDKQQRQIERQERQQLKDLQLLENAQKQHLQLYLKSKIEYFLNYNFNYNKQMLYTTQFKDAIKDDFLKKNKSYIDIVFIYFDDFYYKELDKQIARLKKANVPTPQQQQINKIKPLEVATFLLKSFRRMTIVSTFLIINIFALILAPVGTKRRHL